jgi:hypothetical protein
LEFRLFALELMKTNGSPSANHPDLKGLEAHSGRVEIEEIEPEEVEKDPLPVENGPFKAAVTTLTMAADSSVVQKMDEMPKITPANEALTSNKTLDTEKE